MFGCYGHIHEFLEIPFWRILGIYSDWTTSLPCQRLAGCQRIGLTIAGHTHRTGTCSFLDSSLALFQLFQTVEFVRIYYSPLLFQRHGNGHTIISNVSFAPNACKHPFDFFWIRWTLKGKVARACRTELVVSWLKGNMK